jgi:hypothetical protein
MRRRKVTGRWHDPKEETMSTMRMEDNQTGGSGPGRYGPSDRMPPPGPGYPPGTAGRTWTPEEQSFYLRRRKSPVLAAILSLLPGLGQVYVGYYVRGFINIVVIASTIMLLSNGARVALDGGDIQGQLTVAPLIGLFMAFYWLYNMIDAWRIASFYNEALLGASAGDLKREMTLPSGGGSLIGGIFLVAVGLMLFLNTMFDMPLGWIRDWWPLAPIGFGVYLIVQAVKDRRRKG